MHRRQPLPRLWMMTDERQGEALFDALGRLPGGSGVVFRHYSLAPGPRRALFLRVRGVARSRGLVLMLGGPPRLAAAWGADGSHGLSGGMASLPHLLRSAPVHDPAELRTAVKAGADFVFLSPAFATRSHPGARPLGPVRFGLIARQAPVPVIALGGMNDRRSRRLSGFGIYGWSAIDAWWP